MGTVFVFQLPAVAQSVFIEPVHTVFTKILLTVALLLLAVYKLPEASIAIPLGPASLANVAQVCVTVPAAVILLTVLLPLLAVYTLPEPSTAIPHGCAPVAKVAQVIVAFPDAVILVTVLLPQLAV